MNLLDKAVAHGAIEHGDREDSDYSIEFPSSAQFGEFVDAMLIAAKREGTCEYIPKREPSDFVTSYYYIRASDLSKKEERYE